ncbi:thioredoxin [Cutibacterium acnes JCM 18920]|nr:thioredoxin [Cutibacterium acnes JCM 18920]
MNNVIEVTDATFVSEVLGASKPVLIDYWADWCAPCKQLSPIIEELAGTYGDRMVFAKVDTNATPGLPRSKGSCHCPPSRSGKVASSSSRCKAASQRRRWSKSSKNLSPKEDHAVCH